MLVEDVIKEAEERMKKCVSETKNAFNTLRTGRATPALLEKIFVDYYGAPTPINQLANITVPEARLIVIQPWDKSVLPEIEKAIMKSDLGINPTSDGEVVRLAIPPLTEERRLELVKIVKKKAEDGRVAVRNVRREANDEIKSAQKEGLISEDELKKAQERVQKLTDKYIKEIDMLLAEKEKDIIQI